jgi:hypothetical protein
VAGMSYKHMKNEHGRGRFLSCAAGLAIAALGQSVASAAAFDDASAKGAVKFQPVVTLVPPVLAARLQGALGAVQVAEAAQGTFYAATDSAGKARILFLRNNALAADVTAAASREHMSVDWPGSFAFWLGNLPVVAISWKFAQNVHGIEDFAFWAVEGGGRYLGGLPRSTGNPCLAGEGSGKKDCGRCGYSSNIPVDARLAGLEPNRARFVQKIAANWYYYFGAAAEIFEQDYLLSAQGLAPDGPARRTRNAMPMPQAKERVTGLLRDYFALAKSRSRPEIAPEFLTCFGQLADLAPDFGQAHYNVGCMNALLGNHQQAVAAVTKAISLDPKYRKVARKDPDLGSVRDDPDLARVLGGK